MNVRLSSEGVRVRISLQEAHRLLELATLTQELPLPGELLTMSLFVEEVLGDKLELTKTGGQMRLGIHQQSLEALVESPANKTSSLLAHYLSQPGRVAEVVLEIDLFSLKGKDERRKG